MKTPRTKTVLLAGLSLAVERPRSFPKGCFALIHRDEAMRIRIIRPDPETGAWRCCGDSGTNFYNPPIRTWGYDSLFDTTPPPGTPSGIIIAKSRWARK